MQSGIVVASYYRYYKRQLMKDAKLGKCPTLKLLLTKDRGDKQTT